MDLIVPRTCKADNYFTKVINGNELLLMEYLEISAILIKEKCFPVCLSLCDGLENLRRVD